MAPLTVIFLLLVAYTASGSTTSPQPTLATGFTTNETKGEKLCKSDFACLGCSDILLCKNTAAGYQKVMTLTCKNPTPYCDDTTASCVANVPLPCAPVDKFTCMKDGIFPDHNNCSVYHFCKDSKAFAYVCPKGRYYDAIREECTATSCYTFDCKGKHGLKSYHRGNKNIFSYCSDSTPILVSKCEAGYELNEATQRCELLCKAEGHYADIDDCTKYYTCGPRNVRTSNDCPVSYGFDPVNLRCVPLVMLPSCNFKSPPIFMNP